jgi:cytochrome P450
MDEQITTLAHRKISASCGQRTTSVASVCRLIIEIFRHPEILAEVRREAKSCITGRQGGTPKFDMDRLIRLPWVQTVYAENLRLRIHDAMLRKTSETVNLNGWLIPKNEIIVTCSTTAHVNLDVWSATERGSHPTFEFHPARSLQLMDGQLHFCMNGTYGSWIPLVQAIMLAPVESSRSINWFFVSRCT